MTDNRSPQEFAADVTGAALGRLQALRVTLNAHAVYHRAAAMRVLNDVPSQAGADDVYPEFLRGLA